jgi:hypothetical protein
MVVGRICKTNIRVQLGLVRVDLTQQMIKKHVYSFKYTPFVSRHADQLRVDK